MVQKKKAAPAKKAPVKKPAAKKAVAVKKKVAVKAAPKKVVAKKAPAKKVAAKKVPAKKVAVKKKVVAKTPAAKKSVAKVVAKKTPVKKVAVKKTAVKKTVVKKAAPIKPVAKKVAAVEKTVAAKKVVAAKKPVAAKVALKMIEPQEVLLEIVASEMVVVPSEPLGFPEQVRAAALQVLDERKAEDIISVDLRGRSAIADYAIVASGGSARQLGAIAEYLREAFYKLGVKNMRVEGLPQGDWVLIDAGDVIIHLFRPEVRSFYQIEDVWSARTPAKASIAQ